MTDDLAEQSKIFYLAIKLLLTAGIGYVFIWAVVQLLK